MLRRLFLAAAIAASLSLPALADPDENTFGASGNADPSLIYYSQDSISSRFSDGTDVQTMIVKLKNGTLKPSSIPAIRIFWKAEWNRWVTLDNRRLYAFRQAKKTKPELKIKYVKATSSQVQHDSFKLTSKNKGASIRVRR